MATLGRFQEYESQCGSQEIDNGFDRLAGGQISGFGGNDLAFLLQNNQVSEEGKFYIVLSPCKIEGREESMIRFFLCFRVVFCYSLVRTPILDWGSSPEPEELEKITNEN